MTTTTLIIIVLVVVIAGLVAWILLQNRRSTHLRSKFGPEYQRALQEHGDRRKAEADLERREERVERLHIRPLAPDDRDRFIQAWKTDQARFVDNPQQSVSEADRLITEVMRVRGYPVGNFEQRAVDVSVDHPHVVEHYRAAHGIALTQERGQASTEDLRRAMVHYRALFEELLETHETGVRR